MTLAMLVVEIFVARASSWVAAGVAVVSLLAIAVLLGVLPLASFLPH